VPFRINFIEDVAKLCSERLVEAGYAPQLRTSEDAINSYLSVRHRRVRPQRRRVHKAAYVVPPHLVAGEQKFVEKVEAGRDLWPHQSRKIEKLSVEDGMLNDYGIQHFHLGTKSDPKHHNLILGTRELLFAIVKEHDFYAIGIYDHTAWTRQALLDTVHATWPKLTESVTLHGVVGLAHHYNDADAAMLRDAGINVLSQRPDGSVQMGLGGGITLNGSSLAVQREVMKLQRHIVAVQSKVVDVFEQWAAGGQLADDSPIRISQVGEKFYAVSDPPIGKIEITNWLTIPPL
jgi:hypothetical protein